MYERFTDRARKVMQLAHQEAERFNHTYIGTEHLLLGLVEEGSGVGANVLKNLGIDLQKTRLEIERLVQRGTSAVTMGKLRQTPRLKMALQYAMEEARDLNHNYVGTEHILLGLLHEREDVAAQVLMNLGVSVEQVRADVLTLLGCDLGASDNRAEPESNITGPKHPVSGMPTDLKQSTMQCAADKCSHGAVFHITYVERRKVAHEEHLCGPHARATLESYINLPGTRLGTPRIIDGAKHYDVDVIAISETQQVIYLREVGGDRLIPCLTGGLEATALHRKLMGYQSPRPLAHDAMAMIIRALGAEVQDVIVNDLKEHVYFAQVRIRQGNDLRIVDIRPSDAFMLALAFDCPIFFADKVLDQLGDKGEVVP